MKKYLSMAILLLLAACTPAADPTATATPEPATRDAPAATPESAPTNTAVPPTFTPFPTPALDSIVMDGRVEDWEAYPPLFVDPAGDGGPSGVDLTTITVAHNDTHLFMRADLGRVVNLQSEPALHMLLRMGDDEIQFNFGERIGRWNGESVRQGDIGLFTLPTVTSDVFEIAVPHGGVGEPVSVLFSDPQQGGDVASPDGEPIPYDWTNPVEPAAPRSLDRPEGAIRILSWNVLQDNLFERKLEPQFSRVLQALQPDVILIQEVYIYSDNTALNRITDWLGGEWYAQQQGDLITVSRFPFIENWREGNHNLRARIFPTMIDVNGTPLVIFNAHLRCCDRDQDRQDEADSFIGFLREVGMPEGTPFLLAGDLNLVGDAQQLATLLTGDIIDEGKFGADYAPDWDGTGLADLLPAHTHSPFTITWRESESSFAPGRLDFVIYSDSVLHARGFVLDTSEIPADVLAAYGLQAEDTAVSDHLPLVADVVVVGGP